VLPFLKPKKPGSYPADSRWTVLKGEYSGRPMFVRRNESAKNLQGHAEFVFRLGVAIALLHPSNEGLPQDDEFQVLDAIEDCLCGRFERNQESLLVLAITTGGMREFVFYTRDPTIIDSLEDIKNLFPTHQITSYLAEDRTWDLYREFC